MRLNRFLAASGVTSRRRAEKLISEGRVRVNGEPVTQLAVFVEPGRDRVTVDGRTVRPPNTFTYILLHKPAGFVTTTDDPQGRPKVMTLIPPRPRVFPVGRLDQDTTGGLLFTDDGSLAHRLLHPRYKIEKEYEARVEGPIGEEALEALRTGVLLEDETRPTAPASVEVIEHRSGQSRLRVIVREGRKRMVRRMMAQVGHPVLSLKRVRIGPVALGDLVEGTSRPLTEAEVTALRRTVEETSRAPRRVRGARPHRPGKHARAARGTGAGAGGEPEARAGGEESAAAEPGTVGAERAAAEPGAGAARIDPEPGAGPARRPAAGKGPAPGKGTAASKGNEEAHD